MSTIADRHERCDARALQIASTMQSATGAEVAILFGSRARGDHRPTSDVDILLITPSKPPQKVMEQVEDLASMAQKIALPEASGVDIGCMTREEFLTGKTLTNNLARSIARQGVPAMARDGMGYGREQEYFLDDSQEPVEEESVDWNEVEARADDAWSLLRSLTSEYNNYGTIGAEDKAFGLIAQKALECAYKSVLGSHNIEYATDGKDGHNLRKLADQMRSRFGSPVPGENHSYLTVFGGGAWYAHEHKPLDRESIVEELPSIINEIMQLKLEKPE